MKKIWIMISLALIILSGCKKNTEEWTSIAETKTISLPALSNGKLISISCQEGDNVSQGTILAVMDTMSYSLQKEELKGALSELNTQKAVFDIQIDQSQKDLAYTDSKTKRTASLVKNQSAPEQSLDDVNSIYDKAKSQLALLKKQRELLNSKEKQIMAKISLLDKMISDCVIKAPVNGYINQIFAEEYEALTMSRPVIELTDSSETTAMFYVSQDQLAGFKTGDRMKVRIDGTDKTFEAVITKINSKSEFTPKQILTPDNRTSLVYGLKIRIEKASPDIKDGMPVRVSRG